MKMKYSKNHPFLCASFDHILYGIVTHQGLVTYQQHLYGHISVPPYFNNNINNVRILTIRTVVTLCK
jgi:hypothetical protein